jgi:hypothetical protein
VTTWRILCPGKSLYERQGWIPPTDAPTVAVNGAIRLPRLKQRRPKRLYWCVSDGPKAHAENREDVVELAPIFVVRKHRGEPEVRWGEFQPHEILEVEGRSRMHATLERRYEQDGVQMPSKVRPWSERNLTVACALCAPLLIDGPKVTRIEVWGCDMEGHTDWNCATGEPLDRNKAPDRWERRWNLERGALEEAIEDFAKLGVELIHHQGEAVA